jgi:hypothetical protein
VQEAEVKAEVEIEAEAMMVYEVGVLHAQVA